MNVKWLFTIFLVFGLSACQPTTNSAQEITVFAASSLTDAFNALAEAFETQHDEAQVVLNFAGSSQLAVQLAEGAKADIFASANSAQMESVVINGRISPTAQTTFATNRLTIIVPADNPANITSFETLAQPNVQLILAVEGVPVRQYTDQIAATMPADFQTQFYANVVSEESNVRQVSAKIALGEASAGIVYTSDVTPDIALQVHQIPIPTAQNVIASYPIAPLLDASNPEGAQQFIDFVLSATGQAILSEWGFGAPPAK